MISKKSGLFQKLIVGAAGLLALCWAGSLYAQSGLVTLDPYEIKKRIVGDQNFDVTGLWQALGISARLETVYPRNKAGDDFTLSLLESEITSEEIRLAHSIGELTCASFLRFNNVPLRRLAARSNDRRRLWLKRYFQECEPSAARNSLMEVLGK